MKKMFVTFCSVLAAFIFMSDMKAMEITVKPNGSEEMTFDSNTDKDYSTAEIKWKYDSATKTLYTYDSVGSSLCGSGGCVVLKRVKVTGTKDETLNIVLKGRSSITSGSLEENVEGFNATIESNGPKLVITKEGDYDHTITSNNKSAIAFGEGGLEIVDSIGLHISHYNNNSDNIVPTIYGSGAGNLKIDNSEVFIDYTNESGIVMEGGKVNFSKSTIELIGSVDLKDAIKVKATENPFTLESVTCEYDPEVKGEYYVYGNEKNYDSDSYTNGMAFEIDGYNLMDVSLRNPDKYSEIVASVYFVNSKESTLGRAVPGERVTVKTYLSEGYNLKDNKFKVFYYTSGNYGEAEEIKVDENNSFIMPAGDVYVEATLYSDEISKVKYISSSDYDTGVSWSEIDYADGYELYRATSKTGKYSLIKRTVCKNDDESGCTYYNDTTAKYKNTYYYKVRAYRLVNNERVYGEWSDVKSKTIKLTDPSLYIYSSNYNEVQIEIENNTVATGYQIYRYNSSTKKWVKIATVARKKSSDYYSKYYVDKKLTFNKTYKYRVRAYVKKDGKTYYGPYATQSVKTMLKTPEITSSYVSSSSVKVSWKKVPYATSYKIYVYDYKTGKSKYIATTKNLSYTIKGLAKNTEYEARIYAYRGKVKSDIGYSLLSTVPSLSTTYNYVDAYSLKVSWKKNTNLSGYNICIYSYNDGIFSKCEKINDLDKTSYTFENLTPNKKYLLIAEGFYKNGEEEVVSIEKTKALYPRPVTASVTVTKNAYNKANISWKEVKNATGYQIYRSTNNKTWTKVATVKNTTSYVNTGLITGKKYYYKVRAYTNYNGKSYYGGYSSVKSIILKVDTPNVTESSNYYSTKLTWNKIAGASGYTIYRSTDKKNYKAYKTTTSNTFTDKSVTLNKTYYYRVKAYRTVSGKKYYGNYLKTIAVKPTLNIPTVTATNDNDKYITISYNKVAGATGYEIYVLDTATNKYKLLKTTTALTYNHAGLVDKEYSYKVRAYRTISKKKYYGSYSEVVIGKRVETPAVQ